MPEYALTPNDVRQTLFWLLELTWASRAFRFATDAVNILDEDSNTLVYTGGLSIQFTESMSLFNPAPATPRLSITNLLFPVDVAELIETGHPFVQVSVELSQHVEGDAFERRKVRFRGRMRLTDYDAVGTPVAFSVEAERRGRAVLIPDADAEVTTTTWPDADDITLGDFVPFVIGKPGHNKSSVGGIQYTGGSPAVTIDDVNDFLAICEGLIAATNVVIIDTDAQARTTNNPVTHRVDALGRTFATIDMDPASTQATYIAGNKYQVDWSSDSGSADAGGGIVNPFNTGVLRGAGDVIRWAYDLSGVPFDTGRWAAVADILNAFLIDTYIDSATDLPRWLEKHVFPLLPLAAVLQGPNGVYPVLWTRNVKSTEVVANIDVERDGLSPTGPVRYEGGQFGNELRIKYAPRGDNGRSSRSRTVTGRDVGADTSIVQPFQILRSSQLQYERKARKTITTKVIRDNGTALRILSWQAAAYAFPWRFVSYRQESASLGWLRPGHPVTLTHDHTDYNRHLTNRVCWVSAVEWNNTTPTYTFVLIDSPARDTRPT
ncbi:hypothetical protein LCGC14_1723630 [marine sediment metagenome]|uniref:Tip attachment protein J domain-containing protein n=1 Tax=marine sediment metagenome TaxID=412755 RepID=A0A0F9HBS2_9ZZZZ